MGTGEWNLLEFCASNTGKTADHNVDTEYLEYKGPRIGLSWR